MTVIAGDEQSGLREIRCSIYDTSAETDDFIIREIIQPVERAEAVSYLHCLCEGGGQFL